MYNKENEKKHQPMVTNINIMINIISAFFR